MNGFMTICCVAIHLAGLLQPVLPLAFITMAEEAHGAPEKHVLRWGIIGCGDVCQVKSGPGFYKAKNSRLVAVMVSNSKEVSQENHKS